ncbi:acetyl/propionyl/methylcrotonyl-CoA carboxylase subunit alpha [Sphingomonas sp. PR090111-T3T-6A]|uniref:acetyl/propionyl/methylcrotonyl-CoA carboxylase subunit alpha n=1 Tax=Sphingomonas sp. PR090111-T3T-6A TaxID=685778 RepID=UPI000360FE17|nr:acetyl/propionyl/methylcrotonyl-CoA carboxylase subunit alpha [Sphingomonas sp. PR090111-T3T-6A]
MIQSLLIANRGEIACRIIRTARMLGIRTVAVYSDADRNALHVRMADDAVAIGPAPARESYLVSDRIIAAAKETGAEAIHPGYGFLSENADFAEAVSAAGIVWVGPKPSSIRAMGLKDAAKKLMQEAGVPTTPGYLGEDQRPEHLKSEADKIGYPVLIKAVAGGGGKGMRKVDASADFLDALASCQREAASSFGDDRVLIEKYILSPRHIEVQVFGDSHGNVVHLFERDCSLQRRHQKVIEEAPAPGMDEATREAVCGAAVKAAKAVDYVGAGTIEFIADASEGLRADRIWFMEMNTRLQVEHPVTESITGQDLVEWQLRVASGEPLPRKQDELEIDGWAMEARIYAEDPAKGFLPSIGPLTIYREWRDVRVDSGVEEGGQVTPFYDPMIAKVIAHEATREEAVETLAEACAATDIWPVKTNAPFLWRALDHADFRAARIDTGFIERHGDSLLPPAEPTEDMVLQAAAAVAVQEVHGEPTTLWGADSMLSVPAAGSVWRSLMGFRANAAPDRRIRVEIDGKPYEAELPRDWEKAPVIGEPVDDGVVVNDDGLSFLASVPRYHGDTAGISDGALTAPMPGRVVSVEVAKGEKVAKGQRIVVIEAMKMEQALVAPFDGIVADLGPAAGAQVSEGTLLARIETEEA